MSSHTFNFTTGSKDVKSTSDYLDGLVKEYRVGVSGASEALLVAFTPLLVKYWRLLTSGLWDIDDKDITKFLRMLGTADLELTSERLVQTMKVYDPEDIWGELVLCLYKTAKRYTNISSTFKYIVKQRVITLIRDPIVYSTLADLETSSTKDPGDIDQAWINGVTAGDGWDQLTCLERAVIKLIYWDGLSMAVAAKKLHISLSQLKRCKRIGKSILAKHFNLNKE
jgi:DNA-directed RNA polymerase specialized sigma24 family protein